MKKVSSLLLNARNPEVATVAGRLSSEFDKGDWRSDPHLTGIFASLKPVTESLSGSINRMKAESVLDEKDELRDNYIKAIYSIATDFLHHPDATIKSAAQKVDDVFERFGVQIIYESYAIETATIETLLRDFSSPDILAAINTLPGLSAIIDSLKTAQQAFEAAQLIYQEEKAKEGTEVNATTIRKQVVSIINEKLVLHLNAMAQVDEAKYGTFAATAAQIIDDMNAAIKKRKKAGDKDAGADENKPDGK